MKSGADLARLREISAQQATLIYRLTELKQEEDAILAKYPANPIPVEKVARKKELAELRAEISRRSITEWWKRRKARLYGLVQVSD